MKKSRLIIEFGLFILLLCSISMNFKLYLDQKRDQRIVESSTLSQIRNINNSINELLENSSEENLHNLISDLDGLNKIIFFTNHLTETELPITDLTISLNNLCINILKSKNWKDDKFINLIKESSLCYDPMGNIDDEITDSDLYFKEYTLAAKVKCNEMDNNSQTITEKIKSYVYK